MSRRPEPAPLARKSRRGWGLDPRRRGQRRWDRHPAREALQVSRVGGAQDFGPLLPLGGGQTGVDVVRGHQAGRAVAMSVLYQGKKRWQNVPASS